MKLSHWLAIIAAFLSGMGLTKIINRPKKEPALYLENFRTCKVISLASSPDYVAGEYAYQPIPQGYVYTNQTFIFVHTNRPKVGEIIVAREYRLGAFGKSMLADVRTPINEIRLRLK